VNRHLNRGLQRLLDGPEIAALPVPPPDRARACGAADARIRSAELVAAVTNRVHQPGQNDQKQYREHPAASPSPPDIRM
jgi:hypothetical protein